MGGISGELNKFSFVTIFTITKVNTHWYFHFLFIYLYFSCTVNLAPDCLYFLHFWLKYIFIYETVWFIKFFTFQPYFGLFYRAPFSAIVRWRTNQARGKFLFSVGAVFRDEIQQLFSCHMSRNALLCRAFLDALLLVKERPTL